MQCLHKTSRNALVERRVPIEDPPPIPCADAGDPLAAHARLPWTHGRRTDLCVSSAREATSAAHHRSVSAEYFAGPIHSLLASVCTFYWRIRIGECGSAAHGVIYRLVLGRRLEFCSGYS